MAAAYNAVFVAHSVRPNAFGNSQTPSPLYEMPRISKRLK